MTAPLAHSAGPDGRGQEYGAHVSGVASAACGFAAKAMEFMRAAEAGEFHEAVRQAALFHDLGKLDRDNQMALRVGVKMPMNHVDAGVAHLLACGAVNSAALVSAHHGFGLPDTPHEVDLRDSRVRTATELNLPYYLEQHRSVVGVGEPPRTQEPRVGVWLRLALSCLVAGDRQDSALFYSRYRGHEWPSLDDLLRRGPGTMPADGSRYSSLVQYALRVAQQEGRRRLFMLSPGGCMPGAWYDAGAEEWALFASRFVEYVPHVHEASDYSWWASAPSWDAPVVMTSSGAFLGALGACSPSGVWPLHQVPGSVIVVDRAEAAFSPAHWPVAEHLFRQLSERYGCRVIFVAREPVSVESGWAKTFSSGAEASPGMSVSGKVGIDELAAGIPRGLTVAVLFSGFAEAGEFAVAARNTGHSVVHVSEALCPRDRRVAVEAAGACVRNGGGFVLAATASSVAGSGWQFPRLFFESSLAPWEVVSLSSPGGSAVSFDVGGGQASSETSLRGAVAAARASDRLLLAEERGRFSAVAHSLFGRLRLRTVVVDPALSAKIRGGYRPSRTELHDASVYLPEPWLRGKPTAQLDAAGFVLSWDGPYNTFLGCLARF